MTKFDEIPLDKLTFRDALEEVKRRNGERLLARHKVVCLCGSRRFVGAFMGAALDETMRGKIVLAMVFPKPISAKDRVMLDAMHTQRIEMCDEVLILNVGGYIGKDTRNEIKYAEALGKKVRYLEP